MWFYLNISSDILHWRFWFEAPFSWFCLENHLVHRLFLFREATQLATCPHVCITLLMSWLSFIVQVYNAYHRALWSYMVNWACAAFSGGFTLLGEKSWTKSSTVSMQNIFQVIGILVTKASLVCWGCQRLRILSSKKNPFQFSKVCFHSGAVWMPSKRSYELIFFQFALV